MKKIHAGATILLTVLLVLSLMCGASAAAAPDRIEAEKDHYDSTEFLETIPEWEGRPFVYINNNVPLFSPKEIPASPAEYLGPLDDLGRCGICLALLGQEIMPTGVRGNISEVHPTGWHTETYDFIDGGNLFNRCHLIGWQLTGDDAIPRNLLTGTRYMNTEGMLPFEDALAGYINLTGNHVIYRVTPHFYGDELVARGVQLEAYSIEDEGEGVNFNVFCYNLQPGVDIDYATGDNRLSEDTTAMELWQNYQKATAGEKFFVITGELEEGEEVTRSGPSAELTYVLNTNTHRFHYQNCPSVKRMAEKNTRYYTGTRDEIIGMGYKPCGNCNP
ncbi:MAG: DNA/RNA non-specific endonuclease [Mogibacterium sp.]|nr:DNA/RNA non-specific endonuclease [Mogibacterium sp.]